MSRAGFAFWLVPAFAAIAPAVAGAVPPPPDPVATYAGNRPVCLPRFAILLAEGEQGRLYAQDSLVVDGPGLSLGIYIKPADRAARDFRAYRRTLRTVDVPGIGQARRYRVFEYPGYRWRGWEYSFPQRPGPSADHLAIQGDRFTGGPADYPVLRRVLTGDARRRICPQS